MQDTATIIASPVEEETVEAEFIEPRTAIRRAPAGGTPQPSRARISMDLERWLDVDRNLHELYNLVEIAIHQRDEARAETRDVEELKELVTNRLREWKSYARSLETRLHEAQMENMELTFAVRRTADVAEEALATSRFAKGRRKDLRGRLAEIEDSVTG